MYLLPSHTLLFILHYQIKWYFRKDQSRTRNQAHLTVDDTDFCIKEPQPSSSLWHSHKFKGPGVQCKIAVCVSTGWIAWAHGPFRCGAHSGETTAKLGLHHMLDHGERHIADGGHKNPFAIIPDNAVTIQEMDCMQICRARHEAINRLFKTFASIGDVFARHYSKHALFVHSIINLI